MSFMASLYASIKKQYNAPDDVIPGPSTVKKEEDKPESQNINLNNQKEEKPDEVMNSNQACVSAYDDDFYYVEEFKEAFEKKLTLKAKVF